MIKKVIVAEDVKTALEKERSFLDRSNIRTYIARTNGEALTIHKDKKVDLIIAQLDSPDMSGEDLCASIREDKELREVSLIIVCSGGDSDSERCIQCRANAFIAAPIHTASLLQEAYQLLHIPQRASSRISVRFRIEGVSKKRSFSGSVGNISTSGMLLAADAPLSEGDTITCTFSLPNFPAVTAEAEVVRVVEKDPGDESVHYGIQFIDLSVQAASAIEAFIRKKSA